MIQTDKFWEELSGRWLRLRTAMAKEGADGLIVSSSANMFYTGGRVFSGAVYIFVDREPLFFVRRPVGLAGNNVVYIRKFEDIADYFTTNDIQMPKVLMIESDSISHSEYLRYASIFNGAKIENGTPLLRNTRAVKSDYEVEQIRISARLHAEVYATIPSLYRPSMSDIELSIEIERQSRLHGSLGIFRIFGQSMEIFMGSVIAGDNADAPSPYDFAMGGSGLNSSLPVGCNGTQLREGMSVMVDLGGNFTGYMTDMTRVFSIGKLPDIAYHAHATSIAIDHTISEYAKAGVEAKELYNIANQIAEKEGLSEYFMGHKQKAGFVGHGIGIEINEYPVLAPRSRDVLQENMVFALEPKFVIPGVGAVGIENSFVVHKNGVKKLTQCEENILPLL